MVQRGASAAAATHQSTQARDTRAAARNARRAAAFTPRDARAAARNAKRAAAHHEVKLPDNGDHVEIEDEIDPADQEEWEEETRDGLESYCEHLRKWFLGSSQLSYLVSGCACLTLHFPLMPTMLFAGGWRGGRHLPRFHALLNAHKVARGEACLRMSLRDAC